MAGLKQFERSDWVSGVVIALFVAVLAGCGGDESGNTFADSGAPKLSGQPTTASNAGSAYAFQPSASDPDGDTLTFSIQNSPPWATFDTATGRLSGTPTEADVGVYTGIRISASDGKKTVSLPAFEINVTQFSNGSATLSWLPPTQNTDGSPLTDLAGYKIVYGMDPNALDQVVRLNNPGLTTYMVENLSPATWYFSVKAYRSNGVESDASNLASKSIGDEQVPPWGDSPSPEAPEGGLLTHFDLL